MPHPAATRIGYALGVAAAVALATLGGPASAQQQQPLPAAGRIDDLPLGQPPGGGATPGAIRNPFTNDPQAVQEGKTLFARMNCVYCHGFDADGVMGPTLIRKSWRYGGSPAEIFKSIHDGRPRGMPAWGTVLPAQEIWKIVAYIESLGGTSVAPAPEAVIPTAAPAKPNPTENPPPPAQP